MKDIVKIYLVNNTYYIADDLKDAIKKFERRNPLSNINKVEFINNVYI